MHINAYTNAYKTGSVEKDNQWYRRNFKSEMSMVKETNTTSHSENVAGIPAVCNLSENWSCSKWTKGTRTMEWKLQKGRVQ